MPGEVSESYDPEWGTGTKANEIDQALAEVYERLCVILYRSSPIDIRRLVSMTDLNGITEVMLTERELRLLRFAVERARESL